MVECNYTSNDIFVCGNVFCFFDIRHQYFSKTWSIKEYHESFIKYDVKNHVKHIKILGDLYVYNGSIKAIDNVAANCDVNGLIVDEELVYKGDLLLHGDFFTKGIYAKDSVYSYFNMPVNMIRRFKLKQLFYG